jgi:EAL domain-containing protein (putative c-di-GMP-specific phosphodiesterase class I)
MEDWQLFAKQGYPLKLAINVPASVLSATDFVDEVRRAIPRNESFPGLIVEITEDEIIADAKGIGEVMSQLKLYNNYFDRRFWNGAFVPGTRQGLAFQ